jgi:wyosine [tRNA(Phe)-imidazoG37] synthetase (radical SAM superfamily)
MKIVYGPVSSWRLGKSLGVDLICSNNRICSFNCSYCQLYKPYTLSTKRQKFISIKQLKEELVEALRKTNPDVITFSGTGEPTLANNLNLAIETIKKITDTPIAILTNSTLLNIKDVMDDLKNLDIVVAKLDAHNEDVFQKINRPAKSINFKETINGIIDFRKIYTGKLSIQTMFIKENLEYAKELAPLIKTIEPDEVQINTPLRPCPEEPLSENYINKIEKIYQKIGLNTISVYSSKKPKTSPLDKIELIKRRRSEM